MRMQQYESKNFSMKTNRYFRKCKIVKIIIETPRQMIAEFRFAARNRYFAANKNIIIQNLKVRNSEEKRAVTSVFSSPSAKI